MGQSQPPRRARGSAAKRFPRARPWQSCSSARTLASGRKQNCCSYPLAASPGSAASSPHASAVRAGPGLLRGGDGSSGATSAQGHPRPSAGDPGQAPARTGSFLPGALVRKRRHLTTSPESAFLSPFLLLRRFNFFYSSPLPLVRSKKSVEPGTFQRKRRLKGVGEAALVGSEEEEQEKEEKRSWRQHLDPRRVPAGRAGPGSAGDTGAWAGALPGPGTPPAGAPGLRSEAPPGSCCPLPPRRDGTVPAPARCPRGRSETRAGTLSPRSPPRRAPPAPPGQSLPGRTPPARHHRLPDHATPRMKGPRGVGCPRVGAALIPPEGAMASVSPAHPRAGATSGP